MYKSLFSTESVAGAAGTDADLVTFNMKKLHIMAKVTFGDYDAESPAYLLVSAYGKDGDELYKHKEYEFNPAFMDEDYVLKISDVLDVEPISAINIKIYTPYYWAGVIFDVEIEWEEKGLC